MSWPLMPLSEVAPAKPLKKVQVSDDESVVQITLDHIESNTGRLLNKCYLPVSKAGSSTHWFDEKNVLYSKLRPYLNKVYLPDEIGLGTTELVPLLPDQGRLDRKYLAYYLRSKSFVDWVSSQTAGAKMPRVSMKVFWDHCIPLPPLEEQKRIATILDKADAIRRKRQQAIQLADEFLRAVFLDMFGDPVTNPKGWETREIASGINSITSGWSAKGESYPCGNGEYGVLKISAVTSGKFKPKENKFVDGSKIPSGKALVFPKKGDLLFSRANTRELVGATCIVPEDQDSVFLPDKIWNIKTDRSVFLPEFLSFLIWDSGFRERLTSQATGSSGSMLNISKGKFLAAKAIFPTLALQDKFRSLYWRVQAIIDKFESSNHDFYCAFNSLSQKSFQGDI